MRDLIHRAKACDKLTEGAASSLWHFVKTVVDQAPEWAACHHPRRYMTLFQFTSNFAEGEFSVWKRSDAKLTYASSLVDVFHTGQTVMRQRREQELLRLGAGTRGSFAKPVAAVASGTPACLRMAWRICTPTIAKRLATEYAQAENMDINVVDGTTIEIFWRGSPSVDDDSEQPQLSARKKTKSGAPTAAQSAAVVRALDDVPRGDYVAGEELCGLRFCTSNGSADWQHPWLFYLPQTQFSGNVVRKDGRLVCNFQSAGDERRPCPTARELGASCHAGDQEG